MATPILVCRGCARRILDRGSLQTSRSSNLTARVPRRFHLVLAHIGDRPFVTTRARSATQNTKARATPPSSRPPATPLPRSVQSPSHLGYAQQLADKSSPTTLYEVGPHNGFLFSSYMAGLFSMSGAGINIWVNVYNIPVGMPWVVPAAFGAVGVALAAFGTRFALMPAGMIHSITVLSAKPSKASRGSDPRKPLPSAAVPVRLEIKARRNLPFPFLPLQRLEVDPNSVVMKAALYNRKPVPSEYQKMLMKKEEDARRKKEREYDMDHLMTAPFRHAWQAARLLFGGIRRGITGEGFAPIIIDGIRYKLDITSAYALDEGRALDRIVRIERDPALH
ncbi:hypothetical protein AAE478_003066 [Parahypoxylon ruwenzoriense]